MPFGFLAVRWVQLCPVDVSKILVECAVQCRQSQFGQPVGRYRLRYCPNVLELLRVTGEIVDQLGVSSSEDALHWTAMPRMASRPIAQGDTVEFADAPKRCASKLCPIVHDDRAGQAPVPSDDIAQDHHARAIRRWIERKIEANDGARFGIYRQRQPRAAQHLFGFTRNE